MSNPMSVQNSRTMYPREVVDVPSRPQAEMVHPLPNERYIVVVLFFRIGTSN